VPQAWATSGDDSLKKQKKKAAKNTCKGREMEVETGTEKEKKRTKQGHELFLFRWLSRPSQQQQKLFLFLSDDSSYSDSESHPLQYIDDKRRGFID
jgi:hypothetical protein